MTTFFIIYLIIALLLSAIFIKVIMRYAYNHNLFDKHTKRKIHQGDVPRLGGLAFVPVAIIIFIIALCIHLDSGFDISLDAMGYMGVLLSIAIVYGTGVLDDFIGLRYRSKFIFQFVVGLLLCACGIHLNDVYGLFGLFEVPLIFSCILTIFMIILSINSFNFIDGIDGLSSSIAILSFGYYTVILYLNNSILFMLPLLFICVLLPFFCFNVFGNDKKHSKIFMGDTGSTVIGLLLCVLAIIINEDHSTMLIYKNPIVLAFAPLMLPCFDVFNVVVYRLLKAKNPFKADDNHFHHRLLKLGLSQHAALVVELIVFVVMTSAAIALANHVSINIMLGVMLAVWILINFVIIRIINLKSHI